MENQTVAQDNTFINNVTGNYSGSLYHPEDSLSFDIITLTICGIGTILNSLIVIVIMYGSLMRTSVFMIVLLVLAVTDTLTLLTSIWKIAGMYSLLPLSSTVWYCHILVFMDYTSSIVSSWLIVLISIERTIAIFWPLRVHIYCTKRKVISTILICVVVISVIDILLLLTSSVTKVDPACGCYTLGAVSVPQTILTLSLVLTYSLIPSSIILILNILMMKKLISQTRFRIKLQTFQGKSTANTKSLTLTMFAVCFVFIVTTLPGQTLLARRDQSGEISRVHFPAEQVSHHDSEMVVEREGDNRIGIHLGFLQINHHYEVKVKFKDNLYEDLTADPLQNVYCKVLQVVPTEEGDGHEVVVDFKAYKEKLVREELILTEARHEGKGSSLTLVFHARVLGKGKGTPLLKKGIRVLGIDADDDSEQSDWAGFQ